MAESVTLPITAGLTGSSINYLTDGENKYYFDISRLTATRTLYVPDVGIIMPFVAANTIIVGSSLLTSYPSDSVGIGVGVDFQPESSNIFSFGNNFTNQNASNSIEFPSYIQNFYFPGLPSSTKTSIVTFTTNTLGYSALPSASIPDGTAAYPGLPVHNDFDTGIFLLSADGASITAGGSEIFRIGSNLQTTTGSATLPSFSFYSDQDTGLYCDSNTSALGVTTGGVSKMQVTGQGLRIDTNGSAAAPALTFLTNSTAGIYNDTTNGTINIATNGQKRLAFNSNMTFSRTNAMNLFGNTYAGLGYGVLNALVPRTGSDSVDILYNTKATYNLSTKTNLNDSGYGNACDISPNGLITAVLSSSTIYTNYGNISGSGFLSVAVSNDTLVIGTAIGTLVYYLTSGTWSLQTTLIPTGGVTAGYGCSVDISNVDNLLDYVVVGAKTAGYVYVFIRTGTSWAQDAALTPVDMTGSGQFGYSVSISGQNFVASGPFDNTNVGAIWVYTRDGSWTSSGKILIDNSINGSVANFGKNVSMDPSGCIVAVTAITHSSIYVFRNELGVWTQTKSFDPLTDSPYFVKLTQNRLLIGSVSDKKVYVYTNNFDNVPSLIETITPVSNPGDSTGQYVAVDDSGNNILICGNGVNYVYVASKYRTVVNGILSGNLTFQNDSDGFYGASPGVLTMKLNGSAYFTFNNFYPNTDNAVNLGSSAIRYKDIYLASGTISTSDARVKSNIKELGLGLKFLLDLDVKKFKMNNNSLDGKALNGNSLNDKVHYGLLYQQVKAVMQKHGVEKHNLLVEDEICGLRYEQFIPIITKAVQELREMKNN